MFRKIRNAVMGLALAGGVVFGGCPVIDRYFDLLDEYTDILEEYLAQFS